MSAHLIRNLTNRRPFIMHESNVPFRFGVVPAVGQTRFTDKKSDCSRQHRTEIPPSSVVTRPLLAMRCLDSVLKLLPHGVGLDPTGNWLNASLLTKHYCPSFNMFAASTTTPSVRSSHPPPRIEPFDEGIPGFSAFNLQREHPTPAVESYRAKQCMCCME